MEVKQAGRGGFSAFMYTQFFSAFNDNVYRAVVMSHMTKVYKDNEQEAGSWQSIILAAFMLPFILFSPMAGTLADRYDKRWILIVSKWIDVPAMAIAVIAVFLEPPYSYWGLVVGVFLMQAQSAFFGPAKYGIMPEIIPEHRLVRANGILEMLTMVGIVLGLGVGGPILDQLGLTYGVVACLGIAVLGSLATLWIPRGAPGDRSKPMGFNPISQVWGTFKHMERSMIVMVLCLSLFWLVSAVFSANMQIFSMFVLKFPEETFATKNSYLLAIMSVGIAFGSLLAGSMRSPVRSLGLVPPSALAIGVFSTCIWAFGKDFNSSAIFLGLVGVFGGIYLVPQNAVYQSRSPADRRGAYMAVMNFVSFSCMCLAALVFYLLNSVLKLDAASIFLFIGIGLATVGVLQMIFQPETFVWMVITLVTQMIYRVRVIGVQNIPREGGVLITPNHISLVDALFLIASSLRPLRFVIDKAWYDKPILNSVFRALRLIPIASGSVRGALQAAQDAVKNGDAVVIFPEGELTRTGNIQRFRPGLERIAKEAGVPILPVHLDRLWGSIFSHRGGQIIWKVPRRLPYPVTVTYGELLPPDSTSFQVRQAVTYLATLGFRHRLEARKPLGPEFIRRAKRSPFRFAMSDSMGMKLSYAAALIRSAILSRLIRERCPGQPMVGILFPPSVVGALCNVACQLAGKIAVNLNWTVGKEAFEAAIRKCDLQVILTSRKVLEKLNLEPRSEYVFVEDFAPGVGLLRKLGWTVACFVLPTRILTALLCDRQGIDDDATIIFSSGSTAEPKGIRLTHANILSNCLGVADVFPLTKDDRILGALPFFHSFGFTITIWLPLLGGYGAAYHPNPLDGRGVGKRVRESGATMMTATPTFLQIYTRQCEVEDLKTIRYVIVGAEKLQSNVAEAFEKKFGITPREGYGCTELSPVVSVNAPDVAGPSGGRQVATRPGTIGRPLPGVAVKIVDPETHNELGPGEQGLVLVKGSNVMAGYLDDSERTQAVIKDGWYVTGDIAKVDEDGFITITDRLSRFSKIGGEMVPHVKVEEAIQELSGKSDRVVVVSAISDPDKGERLVVLHTEPFIPSQIVSGLRAKGFPALWIPKPDAFYKIEEIPILGSGKVNLSAIREIAKTRASS